MVVGHRKLRVLKGEGMRRPISRNTLITLLLVAALATPALAGKPTGSSGGLLGACATCRDLATDHLTSDGNGAYCHNSDGQVTIGGDQKSTKGRFRLDTSKFDKTGRLAGLDFSSCVSGACDLSGSVTTEVLYQSQGEYKDSGMRLVAVGDGFNLNFNRIPLGQTGHASLWVVFGGGYRVAFTNETDPISPCVGGSPVAVTCTAAKTDGSCSAWTMQGANACVSIPSTHTEVGLYDMTFSMNIALQQ